MSERLYVGTRKGLFTVAPGTKKWRIERSAFMGDPVGLVMHDARDSHLYAALDLGHFGAKLHRSVDGGATWEEIATPTYPEKPEGLERKDGMGREIPWTTKQIWALAPGGAKQPGRLWCGTIPGGLFKSDDHGKTWELNRPLWDHEHRKEWFGGGADFPGIHSIAVDPRDPRRVGLGVSCGGVWQTEDDGATWHCRADGMRAEFMPPERATLGYIQDPHLIAQCRAEPNIWWAQHHNGIFVTRDNCRSWTEITEVSPSTFGFPVAVHPSDGNTAWFVPAQKDDKRFPVDGKVVVNRTRDGGKTFESLREGLPQEHAYDIVFRHALDIDARGQKLAFGSTTGSLWLTEDQGDRWQTISTHLPPVYCVRFHQ